MSTVLIVDDNPHGREVLSTILGAQGYHLEIAENGLQALQIAENVLPDIVLLDVMMPDIDGYEVCQRMRANPRLREIPIIILTALDDQDSRLQGLLAGADDFLSKPVDRQELSARVRTITRLNRYHTLIEQREHLKEMAERVIHAQEEERIRISRELHDDIGQALTVQQIRLQTLYNNISADRGALRQTLREMIVESQQTFVKMRLLAQGLRPPALDTLGLQTALQAYCSEFSRRANIPCTFEADDDFPDIPDIKSVTLYRSLQEALTNVIKHAQASHVWVELTHEDGDIYLTIQDNGRGISQSEGQKTGIGLLGMQERVTLAGGAFNLRTSPQLGTVISIRFPYQTIH